MDSLQLAQDPNTPSAILDQLAAGIRPGERRGKELAMAIAGNPNVSPETLIALLSTRPSGTQGLAENPATSLLLMEAPELFETIPSSIVNRLLNIATLPAWLVQHLAGHTDALVALSARLHVASVGEVGAAWESELRHLLVALPLADPTEFPSEDWAALRAAWKAGAAPLWVGERLASSSSRGLRDETFDNDPQGRLAEYRSLLQRASGSVELSRMQRKFDLDLTAEELRRLALGGTWARILAARHPAAPPELLEILASDNAEVRERVLKNAATPLEVREALSEPTGYGYAVVRRVVGKGLPDTQSPWFQVALFVRLRDEAAPVYAARFWGGKARRRELSSVSWLARFAAVGVGELTPEALKKLADDANVYVRAAARVRQANPDWRFSFTPEGESSGACEGRVCLA